MDDRLLYQPDVLDILGCSRPTLSSVIKSGEMPPGRYIGGRIAWLASEIHDYVACLPKQRFTGNPGRPRLPEFVLGDRTFRSKSAAVQEVRRILKTTPDNELLTGDDFTLIWSLLSLHHHFYEKTAKGCTGIRVQINHIPGMPLQRGFHIVHLDGTTTDFSIYTAFESTKRTKARDLADACRRAVLDVTSSFKQDLFSRNDIVTCAVTGQPLSWDDAVVDHSGEWSFSKILADWLTDRNQPALVDRGLYCELTPTDAADFLFFHNQRAKLRVIHRRENARLGDRG